MNLIILILMCFKFIGIRALADGIPKIYLYYDAQEPGKYVCRNIFIAIITNKQFYVYVESKNPVDTINRLSCSMNGTTVGTTFIKINEYQQYEFLSNTSLPSTIEHNIGRDPSSYCTFYTHNCDQYYEDMCIYYDGSNDKRRFTIDNGVKCSFSVKVKTEPGQIMGSLSDNEYIMETTTTGDAILTYYDRSQHNFMCVSKRAGYLKFIYTSQNLTKTSTGWFGTSSIDWYMKLSVDNHNATLECHLSDITMAYTIVLRVRLQLMENNPAPGGHLQVYPGFDVNGLVLSRLPSSDELNHHYVYRLHRDNQELLNINILKDNNIYSNFTCKFSITMNPIYGTHNYTSDMIQVSQNKLNGQSLFCMIKVKNDNALSKFELRLYRWYREFFPPPIKPLSLANVLSMYEKQNFSMRPTTVLIYEYNTNTELTCEGSDWKYDDVLCLNETKKGNSNTCTFNLEEAHKYYSVQCSSYWLQLIKKGQATPTSKHLGNDNTDYKNGSIRAIRPSVPVPTNNAPFEPAFPTTMIPSTDSKTSPWLICAEALGSVLVFTIIVYFVWHVCYKKKAEVLMEEHEYAEIDVNSQQSSGTSDVSNRLPHPLPSETSAQSERYVHYDTPYEFRIFAPFFPRRVQRAPFPTGPKPRVTAAALPDRMPQASSLPESAKFARLNAASAKFARPNAASAKFARPNAPSAKFARPNVAPYRDTQNN